MDKAFTNAIILDNDTQAGMLIDFLTAKYHDYNKSKNHENYIYMNKKQRIADKVAAEFGQDLSVSGYDA